MGGTLRRHSKGRHRLVLVGQRAAGSDVEIDSRLCPGENFRPHPASPASIR
jgi:hypothetical protein